MKSYIIGIVCILIFVSIFYYNNKPEHFANYNIIKNGNFQDGNDISSLIPSRENNFNIVAMKNPESMSHVLKQSSFNDKGYEISLDIPKSTNYILSYWLGTNTDINHEYNGPNDTVELVGSNGIITNNSRVVNSETIDNMHWKQIQTVFNSKKNKKIVLKIGKLGPFSEGYRCYSDFVLNANLENISDFYFLDKLVAFFVSNSNVQNNNINSEVNNHSIIFDNPIVLNDNLISLKENYGELPDANKIFPNDRFNNEFSIMFSYRGEEYDTGSILRLDAVNDINSGIEIEVRYNTGIDNKVIVTVGGIKNIYTVGLANKLVNFFITYNKNTINLYVDGVLIELSRQEKLVENKNLGTCPDGWLYEGNNRCVNKSNKNIGNCGNFVDVEDKITNEEKIDWGKRCNVEWKNCSVLEDNNTAPNNDTSCKNNTRLHFANVPGKINNDYNLKGALKALLIYNKVLTVKEIVDINKYFVVKSSMLSVENVFNRPSVIRDSLDKDTLSTPNIDSDCPFNDNRICRSAECSCVNWNTLSNVSKQCKIIVNSYCKNNYDDKKCVNLRQRKCKIIDTNKKMKKKENNNSEIEKLKIEIDMLKKMTNKKTDCKDCDNKVDLNKYIKKNEIPCWGCKL